MDSTLLCSIVVNSRYELNSSCGASNAGFSLVPDVRSSGSTFDYCFNGYNECQSGHRNSGSNTRESEDTSIARIHILISGKIAWEKEN